MRITQYRPTVRDEEKERIIDLFKQKNKPADIASITGRSIDTVYKIVKPFREKAQIKEDQHSEYFEYWKYENWLVF
jgi:transposase